MKPMIYYFKPGGGHIPAFCIPHRMLVIFPKRLIEQPRMYSLN